MKYGLFKNCLILLIVVSLNYASIINCIGQEELNVQDVAYLPMGNTLYVGGNEPNNYTAIQHAVDNATSGDTVFVYSGTYNEQVVIKKFLKFNRRKSRHNHCRWGQLARACNKDKIRICSCDRFYCRKWRRNKFGWNRGLG
jgi:hypothetical protein